MSEYVNRSSNVIIVSRRHYCSVSLIILPSFSVIEMMDASCKCIHLPFQKMGCCVLLWESPLKSIMALGIWVFITSSGSKYSHKREPMQMTKTNSKGNVSQELKLKKCSRVWVFTYLIVLTWFDHCILYVANWHVNISLLVNAQICIVFG